MDGNPTEIPVSYGDLSGDSGGRERSSGDGAVSNGMDHMVQRFILVSKG